MPPASHTSCISVPAQRGWNVRDSDGDRYPLHWAAARGAIKCAEELVGAGADVRVTDRAGHTPASVAFAARQHATYAFLTEQEQRAVTSEVGTATRTELERRRPRARRRVAVISPAPPSDMCMDMGIESSEDVGCRVQIASRRGVTCVYTV